jgi:Uma2 family endonuclease
VDSSDLPRQEREETLGKAALLDDATTDTDLRKFADELLETRRVEYVDEGVLLIMNPPAAEHRRIVRLISRASATGRDGAAS